MPRDPAVRNRTCGYLRAASGMVRRRANASKPQIQCNACRCDYRVAARDEQHLFMRRAPLLIRPQETTGGHMNERTPSDCAPATTDRDRALAAPESYFR